MSFCASPLLPIAYPSQHFNPAKIDQCQLSLVIYNNHQNSHIMPTATTLADQGLKAFNSSNYSAAIDLYTEALAQNPECLEYYVKRSIAYQRSSQHELALRDAEISLSLAHQRGKREAIGSAQLRRGIALFLLKKFGDAGFCFGHAEKRISEKEKPMLEMWKRKLEMELEKLEEEDEKREVMVDEYPGVEVPKPVKQDAGKTAEAAAKTTEVQVGEAKPSEEKPAAAAAPPQGVITPRDKIRHEWYQTPSHVVFTLYVKGVPKDKAVVDITEKTVCSAFTPRASSTKRLIQLTVNFPLPSGSDFVFDVDPLYELVDPGQSTYSILSTKVEVKLLKAVVGKKWADLEGTQEAPVSEDKSSTLVEPSAATPIYPTSSKSGPKDWDKLANELTKKDKKKDNDGDEEDSDVEGGDPVNHFFKKLYATADEDTKRAMMKSYVESNGTALSTNWGEVGKGKVETSPPGMNHPLLHCHEDLLTRGRGHDGEGLERVIILLDLRKIIFLFCGIFCVDSLDMFACTKFLAIYVP